MQYPNEGLSQDEFEVLVNDINPVLVDFYATWCEPCKMLDDILHELEIRMAGKARIIKLDVDQQPLLSAHFAIRSVPTLMIFCKGELVWRMAGFKLAHELENDLRSFL